LFVNIFLLLRILCFIVYLYILLFVLCWLLIFCLLYIRIFSILLDFKILLIILIVNIISFKVVLIILYTINSHFITLCLQSIWNMTYFLWFIWFLKLYHLIIFISKIWSILRRISFFIKVTLCLYNLYILIFLFQTLIITYLSLAFCWTIICKIFILLNLYSLLLKKILCFLTN